jgi:hypothetical protein
MSMRRNLVVSAVVAVLSMPLPRAAARTPSPQVAPFVRVDAPTVALTHVRVIDGTGAPPREDQTVVVHDDAIDWLGDAASAAVPAGAQMMDLHGYTVIPGRVGVHDHLFYLAGGVTTIRTTGSLEPYTDVEIKKKIDAGEAVGPRIHATGPYLEGEGTFAVQMHQLSGPDDAVATVNFWLDEGIDNFKAYMFITPPELSAAVTAAHKRGARVTGHLCSIGFREAASLGIDDLEHGLLVDTEFYPWKKAGECPEKQDMSLIAKLDVDHGPVHDMILDLVRHHVAVTSTLPVFEMFVPGRPTLQARVLEALSPEARDRFLTDKANAADSARIAKRYGPDGSPWAAALKKEMEFERAFAASGGLLLAGEDPTGMGGVLAGFGDQREVELLVEAGFSPVEAIHIATANGAEFLGEADRIGTLAPGKKADLVVIKGDPSKSIDEIENVEIVFKDGVGYDAAKLIESVRGAAGSR